MDRPISYTSGIRKIFSPQANCWKLENCQTLAMEAGYLAMVYDRHIYVLDTESNTWVKTPFLIRDLQI